MTQILKEGLRTRFQRINRHDGGDQERRPWITVKRICHHSYDSVSRGKLNSKENSSLNSSGCVEYKREAT